MSPLGNEMVLGPFQVGSMRIVIASLVLLPIALRHIKKLNKENFGWLLITGLCGNFFPALLFTLAETGIESSLAGLLNMGTSIFVVLIGILAYKVIPNKWQIIGMIMAIFGLFKIFWNQIHFESNNLNYALLVFIATICYAISLTTIKYKLSHMKPLVITALSFLMILLPAIVVAMYTKAYQPIVQHELGGLAVGYLIILSVVGTALAVFMFNNLVAISSPIFSSGVTYLIPIVAVLIGVWDGEQFALENIIWILLILIGVYFMNKKLRPSK